MALSGKDLGPVVVRALPATGGLVAVIWLFSILAPGATAPTEWRTLAKLAAAVAIAFGVTALLRFALNLPMQSQSAPSPGLPGDTSVRDRIAPLVLAIGSAAIAALALGLIITFADLARRQPDSEIASKMDTLLMGVFTAVLPVFATWVGTVLAFYFTKESFKQAADSAREATQPSAPVESIRDRMIPYEKIRKIVKNRAEIREILMTDVISMFNENTTRIIVFTEEKQPIFILRRKTPPMPQGWVGGGAAVQGKKVDDYLKEFNGQNATDATRFAFVGEGTSLDAAYAELRKANSADLFVTATGQPTEPVIGWLPDDRMK